MKNDKKKKKKKKSFEKKKKKKKKKKTSFNVLQLLYRLIYNHTILTLMTNEVFKMINNLSLIK